MSSDPKKPFDAAPNATPDLLQQDLSLDRRAARRVPTFTELQAAQVPPPPPPSAVAPPNLQRRPAPPSPQQFAQERIAAPQPPAQSALRPPPPPPMSVPTPAARPPPAPAPLQLAPQAAVFRPSKDLPQAPTQAPAPMTTQRLPTFSGTPGQPAPAAAPHAPIPMKTQAYGVASPAAPQRVPRETSSPATPPRIPSETQAYGMTSPATSPQRVPMETRPPSPPAPQRIPLETQAYGAPSPVAPPQRIPPETQAYGAPSPAAPPQRIPLETQAYGAAISTTLKHPAFSPQASEPAVGPLEPQISMTPQRIPLETQAYGAQPLTTMKQPAFSPQTSEPAVGPLEPATTRTPSFGEELSTEPAISLKAAPVATRDPHPNPLPRAGEGAAAVVRAEPAALWRRAGAWLVDLSFIALLVGGFLFIAMSVIAPKHLTLVQQLSLVALPGAALAGMLAFVYTTLFAFLWNGRTPGRRALGIHLVDTSGHAPGPMRALTRAGLSLVSFGLFLSGFWLALFDRHGQTLHDKLTRTFVVRLSGA